MNKESLSATGLFLLTFFSRMPFQSRIPFGLDSIQFVLGLIHYDVRLHQPHPPGSFLFVMLGRTFSLILQDPNLSFIALNILFSGLGAVVFYRLARSLIGSRDGLLSTLLLVTSPVFWFHGEVALSNAVDCSFVSLVAWLCWRNLNKDTSSLYLSALALGLSGGIRQNTLVFLIPLWVFSVARASMRKKMIALVVLLVSAASWYLPMATLSGGLVAYQTALRDHWLNSNWHGFTLSWIPFNLVCVGYFVLLGTGLGFLFLLLGSLFWLEDRRLHPGQNRKEFFFFLFWLAPPLVFFIFVYSHPVQTGHSLIYLPALLLLMPKCIELTCVKLQELWCPKVAKGEMAKRGMGEVEGGIFGEQVKRRKGKMEKQKSGNTVSGSYRISGLDGIVIAGLVACNCYVFLGMNTAVSRARIRDYEAKVADMTASIRTQCAPDQTILINDDFMFLGFRDMMYHMPEYHTFQPRLYSLAGKPLLFSGYLRQTQLLDHVVIPSQVRYFVLNADEFNRNPGLIRGFDLSRLPTDRFLWSQREVRWFRGDIQDLPQFFPAIQFSFDDRRDTNNSIKADSMVVPVH